jgi:hypothetical protein
MSCILNINRFLIPNDVITTLTSIYKYIGKNESYEKTVNSDLNRIVEQTIERDCYFLAKILKLDITDPRMRLIITKDSAPRNKDESALFNIKEMLKSFQINHKEMTTQSNDLVNIVNYINPNQNIKYDYDHIDKKAILKSQSMRSKRILLDEVNEEVNKYVSKEAFEPIILYLHYFVDFYNLEPFTSQNESASYLLLYLLLLKADIYSFKFVSFFEILFTDFNTFIIELKNASFNWKEGFSQTLGFVRFMSKIILKSYIRTNEIIKEYEFDSNLNKSDNIENTISKLPDIFTKDEIRLIHPYISESTINRTLSKLKDDNLIKPLGKGRSAKWIKK